MSTNATASIPLIRNLAVMEIPKKQDKGNDTHGSKVIVPVIFLFRFFVEGMKADVRHRIDDAE